MKPEFRVEAKKPHPPTPFLGPVIVVVLIGLPVMFGSLLIGLFELLISLAIIAGIISFFLAIIWMAHRRPGSKIELPWKEKEKPDNVVDFTDYQ